MIKSSFIHKYRIKEFLQFIRNILMIVKQHGPLKLKIKDQYEKLNQDYDQLQEAYKADNTSELTPQLENLDEQRDALIICLRQVCDGFRHHHKEDIRTAASEVVACIDKYGSKLYHLSYTEETAALKNLARDLKTIISYVEAIKLLHLEDVVDEMDRVNTKFERIFVKRLEEFSRYQSKSTMEMVKIITESYRTLVQHITANATLTPSGDYDSLISHLNENIDHFNQRVERRKNNGDNEDGEDNREISEIIENQENGEELAQEES